MNGQQLKEFRKSKRWTQKQVGKELGLTQNAISQLENGKRKISLTVEKLIECLRKAR